MQCSIASAMNSVQGAATERYLEVAAFLLNRQRRGCKPTASLLLLLLLLLTSALVAISAAAAGAVVVAAGCYESIPYFTLGWLISCRQQCYTGLSLSLVNHNIRTPIGKCSQRMSLKPVLHSLQP
jgi:hypothetical protein